MAPSAQMEIAALKGNGRARAEYRRQQIISGALSCFEKNGFHETSINDIALASSISTGLIYKYFVDKRDVLFAVIMDIIEAYNRDIPSALIGINHPIQRFEKVTLAYFKVIDDRVSATLLAYREVQSLHQEQIEALKAKELQTNRYICESIKECVDAGFFHCSNTEVASYQIVTAAHAWGLKNWRLRQLVTFDEYVEQTLGIIASGLLTAEGKAETKRVALYALKRN